MSIPCRVEVTVLADSEASDPRFRSSYGLSLHVNVQYQDGATKSFLFDTSESWATLRHNLEASGLGCGFRKIVISHWHRDHYGGLRGVVEACASPVKVYVPSRWLICRDLEKMGADIVECKSKTLVYDGVWAVGPISGSYELAVKIKVEGLGSILLTGCGHAGASNILRWTLESGESLYGILGGLHIRMEYGETTEKVTRMLRDRGMRFFVPLHHKFRRASRFRRELEGRILDLGAGARIVIDSGSSTPEVRF